MIDGKEPIVHVFPKGAFTNGYIHFVNEKFMDSKHLFLVYGKQNDTVCTLDEKNVIEHKNIVSILREKTYLKNSRKIIFHGVFSFEIYIWLFLTPSFLKKTYFVFWGGDLYCYNTKRKGLKVKILSIIRKSIVNNVAGIVNLIPEDFELVKKLYKPKGKNFLGVYSSSDDNKILECCLKKKMEKEKKDYVVNIQIGNSATPTNRHLEVFELLKCYANENIKLYVPLSYGDEEYKKQVIQYGKDLFGDKFVPLTEFMEFEKYSEFLANIDIGIFNNNRQQAMGNICYLAYLGCKIYLAGDMPMWSYYKDYVKCKFFKIESISNCKYEDFIEIKEEIQLDNRNSIEWLLSEKRAIELWKDIFKN